MGGNRDTALGVGAFFKAAAPADAAALVELARSFREGEGQPLSPAAEAAFLRAAAGAEPLAHVWVVRAEAEGVLPPQPSG